MLETYQGDELQFFVSFVGSVLRLRIQGLKLSRHPRRLKTGSMGSSTTTTTMATPRTIFHFDGQIWTESSRQKQKVISKSHKKEAIDRCAAVNFDVNSHGLQTQLLQV